MKWYQIIFGKRNIVHVLFVHPTLKMRDKFCGHLWKNSQKTLFLLDIAQITRPLSPAHKLGKFVNSRKSSKSKQVEINVGSPSPLPCMPIWATFAFSFTKVSESVWAGGPPNMGNAQKKERFFFLGRHPLVNGPISWGSTQTSYTCHGHRPCLGDIPFHKAPSFCKWQAFPSFRWSHMFGPGHEYSFVGKWTKFFCAIQWSPIPSLTSLSRNNLVGAPTLR